MKSHEEAMAILLGSSKPNSTRARSKPKAPPPNPVLRPIEVAVLSVDGGTASSGVSIWVIGKLAGYDEIKRLEPAAMDHAIESAALLAEAAGVPLVLVFEEPPPPHVLYEGRNAHGVVGVNRAIEVWLNAWRRKGYDRRRFIGVRESRWRSAVLGKGWGNKPREQTRPREQAVARVIAEAEGHTKAVGPDAAPAICLGFFGSRAGEVARAVLPSASRRRGSSE